MTSILKVDQIQTTAGAAPTAKDLGFAAGSVVQFENVTNNGAGNNTSSTSFVDTGLSINITPKFATSKIFVMVHQVTALLGGTAHTRCDFRCIEANSGTELYRMDYHGQDGVFTNTHNF